MVKRLKFRLVNTNNTKNNKKYDLSCYNEYEIHIFLFYKNKGGQDGTFV